MFIVRYNNLMKFKQPFRGKKKIVIFVTLFFVAVVGIYGAYLPFRDPVGIKEDIHLVPDSAVVFLSDETLRED